jgi:hypothetical protein
LVPHHTIFQGLTSSTPAPTCGSPSLALRGSRAATCGSPVLRCEGARLGTFVGPAPALCRTVEMTLCVLQHRHCCPHRRHSRCVPHRRLGPHQLVLYITFLIRTHHGSRPALSRPRPGSVRQSLRGRIPGTGAPVPVSARRHASPRSPLSA